MTRVKHIFKADTRTKLEIPMTDGRVPAGFPSPAQDFAESTLDLNEHLIRNKAATYIVQAEGDSMREAGIFDGDLLVVDASLEPYDNCVVIAAVDGEFTVKRYKHNNDRCWLQPENPDFDPIEIDGDITLQVFGVVVYSIHRVS